MPQIRLGDFRTTSLMRKHVEDVLTSGRLSYGPKSVAFEQQFAAMHGCEFGVISNSGTSALVVAIQTLKELHRWSDGDEIIVPALTFVATINAILHNNLTPVLVDVEREYYNIDYRLIKYVVSPSTRAILPVHLFGQPANMSAIMETAWEYDLQVLEDSCETVGATIDGKIVGSIGDIGCFSTYVAHHVVTGVGGLCTTNNPVLATHMRSLVNHGISLSELPNGEKYDPTFLARNFRFDKIGHSFRVTELEAALGLGQLDTLDKQIMQRVKNAERLIENLEGLQDVLQLPTTRANATHSYMVFPIVLLREYKHGLKAYLQSQGVEVRDMVPLTNQPCYREIFNPSHYKVADWINDSGLYVGCHQHLTLDDMDYIADTIKDYFGR